MISSSRPSGSPLADSDGKSGATLERAVLADGRSVVVKRFDPEADLVMRISGDTRGREVEMWESGIFDRLPADVGHAVIGGWFGDDGLGVLVMRDLGRRGVRLADPGHAGPVPDDAALGRVPASRLPGATTRTVWRRWTR